MDCLTDSYAKLGSSSNEAMKRRSDAMKLLHFNFFASVKRFIASLLYFLP
jgi:hypothetical protein